MTVSLLITDSVTYPLSLQVVFVHERFFYCVVVYFVSFLCLFYLNNSFFRILFLPYLQNSHLGARVV
jgi:hypothetical protein